MSRILLIDPHHSFGNVLERELRNKKYKLIRHSTFFDGLRELVWFDFDIIIWEPNHGENVMEKYASLKRYHHTKPLIICSDVNNMAENSDGLLFMDSSNTADDVVKKVIEIIGLPKVQKVQTVNEDDDAKLEVYQNDIYKNDDSD